MNRPNTSRPWLRTVRRLFAASPTCPAPARRNSRLRLTHLEDRVTPAANVLANAPEASQGSLSAFFTQSETSSIAFGNIVLVAYNDSGSNSTGNRFTGYARSTDGGATFTDMGALTSANNDAGDPVFARDAVTGRIYLSTLGFTTGGIQVFRSDDDGLTFRAPVTAFNSPAAGMDKEWIAVDNFPGPGQGNVYLIGRDFGAANAITFTRSTDGGATWSTPSTITTGDQGAWVVVNADHSVSTFWLQGNTLRTRRSTNFGQSFNAPVTITTLSATGINGNLGLTRSSTNTQSFRSNVFPSVVASPVTPGVLYMVYADKGTGTDKANVEFTQSNNFGATWSPPVVVNTVTTNDQWQPAISITPNGRLLSISWYDRRNSTTNSRIEYFARNAVLTGTTTTFMPDVRISDASFLPDFGRDNVVNPSYMGDYDHSSATNTKFYYIWADNRLGGPDVRVAGVPIVAGGPFVAEAMPAASTDLPTPIDITFDQAINPASFSIADDVVAFTRNGVDVKSSLTGFTFVNGNTTLRLTNTMLFPGAYVLRLGTQILSASTGNPLDNNFNGTPGEAPADEFVLNFIVPPSRVTSATPSGAVNAPVTSATFDFAQAMDTTSFDPAVDVFSFTGPLGNLRPYITGFQWVTNKQLRLDFLPQTIPGNYSLVLNPSITTPDGTQLDNNRNGTAGDIPGDRFTTTFTIGIVISPTPQNDFGYRFGSIAADSALNLVPGAPDVTSIGVLANADDVVAEISLGSNAFNFYGTTYNTVFVSSNGNLHFGSFNTEARNVDLTVDPPPPPDVQLPPQAFIAGLWDDLLTSRNTPTDDLVLMAFRDVSGDGQPDLIISYRNVHYYGGPINDNDGITFQIVLQLNTGNLAGDITFNYLDLDEPGAMAQTGGASATVGIKREGADVENGDPLQAAFDGSAPTLVGSNKALRFFKNDGPTANANGPYTVASGGTVTLSSAGTTDPEGNPLIFAWDLDADGTFGEVGVGAQRGDEVGPSPVFNAAGLAPGAYQIALRVFDTIGNPGNATATVNVTNVPAPRVSTAQVNGSADPQRSGVRSLVVTFNANVTLPGNVADAFRLEKLGAGGGDVALAGSAQVVGGLTVVTLTFTGGFTEGAGSFLTNPSLVDGNYRLTARANLITVGGVQLDGDGNGTGGDDYVLGNAAADGLFRLYGDANGDRADNAFDFGQFRNAFGSSNGDAGYRDFLDFNGDGTINAQDFGQFRNRFGLNLPFP